MTGTSRPRLSPEHISVLHSAGLYGRGGLELAFVSFFESPHLSRLRQATVLTRIPQPAFAPFFERNAARVFRTGQSNDQRTWTSRLRIAKVWSEALLRHRPEVVLFWNEIPPRSIRWMVRSLCPKAKLVLFDRGKSIRRPSAHSTTIALNGLDAIVANARGSEFVLRHKHGVRTAIHVVHNPLKTVPPRPKRRRLAENGRIRLGYAGRLGSGKGVLILPEAMRILRGRGVDCELWVAGAGPAEARMRQLAEVNEVGGACRWLGHVNDMGSLYDEVDVVIVPSLHEAFGNVSIEAQSWGVPVIISRVDGLPETIVEGVTGLSVAPTVELTESDGANWLGDAVPDVVFDLASRTFRPPRFVSADLIADAVQQMTSNAEKYSSFSAAAREHVLQMFDPDVYAKKIVDVFSCISESFSSTNNCSSKPDGQ